MSNSLDIFCFTSAARTKSFSITARELKISQQAVSKHIKTLEEELGYPLFFRNRTSLDLTAAGSYMLDYFKIRGNLLQDIAEDFPSSDSAISLTVGISQWIKSPPWFIERTSLFRKEHPEIDLHLLDLDAGEAVNMLREGGIDMFLTSRYMSRYLPLSWKCILISKQPLYLLKSRRSPYADEELSYYPFFIPASGEENEETAVRQVCQTCARIGFTPRNVTVCHDMGSVMLNVLLNEGLTLGCYVPDRGSPEDYIAEQTGLSVELVLCYPRHSSNPYIALIKDYFTEGAGDAENTD